MEVCFKILLLTKYSFDLPRTENCIYRQNGTFWKLMIIRLKYYSIDVVYEKNCGKGVPFISFFLLLMAWRST